MDIQYMIYTEEKQKLQVKSFFNLFASFNEQLIY